MKKLLSMALMLMMVLTLFAVPAMAEATTVYQELIYDGGFEATNTEIGSANTAYGFIVDSAATAYADAAIKKDGNYSMRIETTDPADPSSEFRSNTFAITARAELKLSADVYLTTVSPEYGTGAVQFVLRDTTSDNVGWGPGRATAEGFEKDYVASTGSGFMFDGLPLNTWVHVECTSTPTVTKTGSYLYVRPQSSKAYMDNLSVKKAVTGYGINVTELNDFGTVSASEAVAADGTTDILVIPEKGYYPYEITLNGTNVTAAAVKKYAAVNYAIPYWSYTLDGSTLTADAEITVTYGYYTYGEELAPGGDAEGLTVWNETKFGRAGNSVVTLDTTIAKGTQSFKVTSAAANTYNLRTPTIALEPGATYVTEFDAYTDSTVFTDISVGGLVKVNNVYIVAMNGSVQANLNMKQNSYLPLKTGEWMHFAVYFDNTSATETTERAIDYKMTCANDTDSVYFDNITFKKLTEAGAAPLAPVEPTTANVTINSDANANITLADAVVEAGGDTTFTVAPKFGYYIQSITVGGTAIDVLDAYKGGTYTTGAISADTAIVVTIAALADSTIEGVSTDVATLPAVFAPAADTAVTFGKVLDNAATEYGIYLTNAAGEVKTVSGVGPYFAADIAKGTANGQFAIEFIGLEAGTYTAKTYVVVGGETTFGVATTFVVAE